MRRTGWGGELPLDDEQAVARILAASREAIERKGAQLALSDVAKILNVTRQTVYRYFPSTEALVMAVAIDTGRRVAAELEAALKGITDPAAAVVELVARTTELLTTNKTISFLLGEGSAAGVFTGAITDETSQQFAVSLFAKMDIDWAALGFDDDELRELAGWGLLVVDGLLHSRRLSALGDGLRAYLTMWLAPAVASAVADGKKLSRS